MKLQLANMIRIPLAELAKWVLIDFEHRKTFNPDKQTYEVRAVDNNIEIVIYDKPKEEQPKIIQDDGGIILPLK